MASNSFSSVSCLKSGKKEIVVKIFEENFDFLKIQDDFGFASVDWSFDSLKIVASTACLFAWQVFNMSDGEVYSIGDIKKSSTALTISNNKLFLAYLVESRREDKVCILRLDTLKIKNSFGINTTNAVNIDYSSDDSLIFVRTENFSLTEIFVFFESGIFFRKIEERNFGEPIQSVLFNKEEGLFLFLADGGGGVYVDGVSDCVENRFISLEEILTTNKETKIFEEIIHNNKRDCSITSYEQYNNRSVTQTNKKR